MFSKPVAVGALLVLACITGAAGGAYFAGRQSTPEASAEAASVPPAPVPASAAQDTEAVITPSATTGSAPAPAVELPTAPASVALETERVKATPAAPVKPRRSEPAPAARSSSGASPRTPAAPSNTPAPVPAPTAADPAPARPEPPAVADPTPVEPLRAEPLPPARELVELEVPSTSVIGLRIETPLSTETAHLEDRVEARVMRDLTVDGRTAIPAGTRALGAVTMVERGGKVKERARLGVRFHTLVLAAVSYTHLTLPTN